MGLYMDNGKGIGDYYLGFRVQNLPNLGVPFWGPYIKDYSLLTYIGVYVRVH